MERHHGGASASTRIDRLRSASRGPGGREAVRRPAGDWTPAELNITGNDVDSEVDRPRTGRRPTRSRVRLGAVPVGPGPSHRIAVVLPPFVRAGNGTSGLRRNGWKPYRGSVGRAVQRRRPGARMFTRKTMETRKAQRRAPAGDHARVWPALPPGKGAFRLGRGGIRSLDDRSPPDERNAEPGGLGSNRALRLNRALRSRGFAPAVSPGPVPARGAECAPGRTARRAPSVCPPSPCRAGASRG